MSHLLVFCIHYRQGVAAAWCLDWPEASALRLLWKTLLYLLYMPQAVQFLVLSLDL